MMVRSLSALREGPDRLIIFVNIPYLRQRLAPLGDSFRLQLNGFRSIFHFSNDIGDSDSEIADIAGRKLEILSTDATTVPAKISVEQRTLTIDFDSVEISLDTGQPLTFEQLWRASEEYSDKWSARVKAANQPQPKS